MVSVLPESVAAAAKHLKQPEPLVRAKAVFALRGLVDGAAGVGSSIHAAALKAATKAAADRSERNDREMARRRCHRVYAVFIPRGCLQEWLVVFGNYADWLGQMCYPVGTSLL